MKMVQTINHKVSRTDPVIPDSLVFYRQLTHNQWQIIHDPVEDLRIRQRIAKIVIFYQNQYDPDLVELAQSLLVN